MKNYKTLSFKYNPEKLEIIDQRYLPKIEKWVEIKSEKDLIDAVVDLKVRGAPLIGIVAAAFVDLQRAKGVSSDTLKKISSLVIAVRPTAVNVQNMLADLLSGKKSFDNIYNEDVLACKNMANVGLELISEGDNILTHCNTGGLATAGIGTALGVITNAALSKKIHVYVDETRPLLQGGRLTAWELVKSKVPHTIICDSMAAMLMKDKLIDKIFVGADRIALNGDFANKIGTYSVAVLAHFHKIPFYVVAPSSTIDTTIKTGAEIKIENRKDFEVKGVSLVDSEIQWAPEESRVFNPAFDVTPAELIHGAIIDDKVYSSSDLLKGALSEI